MSWPDTRAPPHAVAAWGRRGTGDGGRGTGDGPTLGRRLTPFMAAMTLTPMLDTAEPARPWCAALRPPGRLAPGHPLGDFNAGMLCDASTGAQARTAPSACRTKMHTLRGADETEGSVQRSPEPQDWIYQWHLKLVLSRRYLMITAKTDTCISFISKGVLNFRDLNDFYLRFCVVKTNSGCNR
jgi:hypothetical protein